MLHFIYRDALIEDVELVASSSACASSESDTLMEKLLAAADKYGLARLRRTCESHICKDVSVHTVAKTLAQADRYHATELKTVCLRFAAENLAGMLSIFCLVFLLNLDSTTNVFFLHLAEPSLFACWHLDEFFMNKDVCVSM